jgi:hypothetical protein
LAWPDGHPYHPSRPISPPSLCRDEEILRDLSREFDKLYATIGRPSIPPERLLRAQLSQAFTTFCFAGLSA